MILVAYWHDWDLTAEQKSDPEPYIPPEPTPEEKEKEEEYKRSLQFVKDSKIEYMSYLCHQTIENGILITLSDGLEHSFALTENDQTNLMERQAQLMAGATQVSYHADGELCTYYSAEDMTAIIQASIFHKDYQTTYFNSLKHYINSMTDKNEVSAVEYGIEIPEQYQSQPLKDLLAQLVQLHVNENQVIENQTIEDTENEGDSNEVDTE